MSVAQRIDTYIPAGSPPGWSRVAGQVRRTVATAEPLTPYSAAELLSVLTRLALFADAEGLPARPEVWLSREVIERFITAGCLHLASGTRATYRSRLLRLREAVLGGECATGRPVKLSASTASRPYAPTELAALWAWAGGQPTAQLRQGCQVLLALGRGCGLDTPEIVPLRAHDVRRPGSGAVVVAVRGRRSRLVVCRRAWEPVLAEAARLDGQTAYLFRPGHHARGKNTVTGFLARTHPAPAAPALKMSRLRAGWLVELMETGVPLPVIVAAAGLDSLHALSRLLPFLRGTEATQAAEHLRGRP
ncbi:hypothetical protein [Planomonospora sp. ID82291]|uniref:hypothetical protein n=1 Tax=Planomonospora sp. ID82291 TaxID=2738136 RepID=UPI0018C355FE|nr:hypothetical protein [Planomonospora sp. ID82291]